MILLVWQHHSCNVNLSWEESRCRQCQRVRTGMDCYLGSPNSKKNEMRHCSRQCTRYFAWLEVTGILRKGERLSEGLLSDDTERTAKHVWLMNSLFLGLSDLCQAFHTKTTTLFAPFLYTVALYGMMLLVEAFTGYKQDANGRKGKKQGQLSDFGCGIKLLWLEIATSSPGVSLYYKEMVQCLST